MNITSARIQNLLQHFQRQRILVIGDLMLDRYIYGSVTRISPCDRRSRMARRVSSARAISVLSKANESVRSMFIHLGEC